MKDRRMKDHMSGPENARPGFEGPVSTGGK